MKRKYDFSKYDFTGLTFDFEKDKPGYTKMVTKWPRLKMVLEDEEIVYTRDCNIIKYVILMADKHSPFIAFHKDYHERQKAVVQFLGITIGKVQANESAVNRMITRFLKMRFSTKYMAWYSYNVSFGQLCERLREEPKTLENQGVDLGDVDDNLRDKLEGILQEKSVYDIYAKKQSIQQKLPGDLKYLLELEAELFPDSEIREIVTSNNEDILSSRVERSAESANEFFGGDGK